MTDPDWEPTEPALHDQYGSSTAPKGKITRSETTTIHEHQDLIDRNTCTTINRLQNQSPSRHTHLQPVAPGGGQC